MNMLQYPSSGRGIGMRIRSVQVRLLSGAPISGRSSVCAERPAWDRKAESLSLSTPTNYQQVA